MRTEREGLEVLAGRVERGDAAALGEFRRRLEVSLLPVVRRALRGSDVSPLTEHIRETARRAAPGGTAATPELVARVAATVCAGIVSRLRAGANTACRPYDTVAVRPPA